MNEESETGRSQEVGTRRIRRIGGKWVTRRKRVGRGKGYQKRKGWRKVSGRSVAEKVESNCDLRQTTRGRKEDRRKKKEW